MKICKINEIVSWTTCTMEAWSLDPEGLCIIHSRQDDKDKNGDFSTSVQRKIDSGDYNFRKAFFPFQHFKHKFCNYRFNGDADFSYSIFNAGANFDGASFNGKVYFNGAIFYRISNFSAVDFKFGGNFTHATFIGPIVFTWATIGGPLYFIKLNSDILDKQKQDILYDFRYLQFTENGKLLFQDVSLAQAMFIDTDLRRVDFNNVSWYSRHGRKVLDDEISLKQPCKNRYAEVERLYRNLKMNYEREGDYKNAGDFHFGEMEMHRRASKWRWFPFYWYNLYLYLSGYGERPSWALGWLAAFLAIFTGLLAWAGLDPVPPHVPAFGDSFFYLLQKVTLQRPTWADPLGFGGKLVAGLSVLLIPGQAALFLLALRNRLGRRR